MADQDLRYKIGADDSDARRVLDGFARRLEDVQKKTEGAGSGGGLGRTLRTGLDDLNRALPIEGLDRLSLIFSAAGPFAIGAAVIGVTTVAVAKLVGQIDDLDEAAQGLGLTATSLADLRIGAQQAGVGVDQLTKAIGAFNSKADDAISGNKDAIGAFARFGIDATTAAFKLQSAEQRLNSFADAFKGFANDSARGAAAADLLGQKLGPRLSAFLAQGSDALKVSSGLTQEMVDEAVRAQKEIDKLSASWDRLKFTLGGAAAVALNTGVEAITKVRTEVAKVATGASFLTSFTAGVQAVGAKAAPLLERVFGGDPDEQVRKAQETVDKLKAILGQTDAFVGAQAAIRKADDQALPSIGDKEDRQAIEQSQQALASYVQTLVSAIEATEDLTNVQKTQRALARNQFGPLIEGSAQAKQALLDVARQADQAIDFTKQRDSFTQLVQSLEQVATATQKLTNAERAEQFLSRNPRAARSDQEKETLRTIAAEADAATEAAAALQKLNKEHEAFARAAGAAKTFGDDLTKTILELSGRTGDERKIVLTAALERLIPILGLTKEEAEKAALGIAGLTQEAVKSDTTVHELGLTFTSALENAAVSGGTLSDVLRGLGQDLLRLAVRKNLTEPFLDFFDNLNKNKGGFDAFIQSLLGVFGGGGGGTNLFAGDQPGNFSNVGGGGIGDGGGLVIGQSLRGGASSKSVTIIQHIDARGATDASGIARAASALRKQTQADYLENKARKPGY